MQEFNIPDILKLFREIMTIFRETADPMTKIMKIFEKITDYFNPCDG